MDKKHRSKKLAVNVEGISKSFMVPHERIDTVRGQFVHLFKKKSYEKFAALDDVSFEVQEGEFFSIIGKNGSGKSTLLKILAGIYTADSGRVRIHGRISPFLELGIGFNPELSGRDNIYLNATVLGLSRKQIDEKFDDIVAFSELYRFIDQKIKNYSSGMQVRLAFSVAIHANREILLMDEVLAVGDANFQTKCLDIFRKMKKEGKTIIFVSHDLESVKEFSDRAVVLHEGKVQGVYGPYKAAYIYSQILMKEAQEAKQSSIEVHEKKSTPVISEVGRIDSITTVNTDGRDTMVFERGDDLVVRAAITLNRVVDDLHIGIGIVEKQNDTWVSGNNTFFDSFHHSWKNGKNIVDLRFSKNNFNRGDFFLLGTLFIGTPKDNKVVSTYDSRDERFYFRSMPRDPRMGLVYMNHEWNHK